MSFETWIATTGGKSGFCTSQVVASYFSAFLCALCVFAVKVCYFKAAKMRSRIDSIEPMPATFTYFGAPGTPLFAQFE